MGLAPGEYTVTVTCDNDCSASETFVVPDINSPCGSFSSLNVNGMSCFGVCDGSIVGVLAANCDGASISVNGGPEMSDLNLQDLCAGEYEITVFQNGEEAFSQTVTINEPDPISVNIELTCVDEGFDNGAIDLNISGGTAPYEISWSPPNVEGENPQNLSVGSYIASITDANGCDFITQPPIVVSPCEVNGAPCFEASNIITPNNDGTNDNFFINCAPSVSNTLEVYDRWGRLVFGSSNYLNNWDGTDEDGDVLPEGAYMWVMRVDLSLGDERLYHGTVTLLRD